MKAVRASGALPWEERRAGGSGLLAPLALSAPTLSADDGLVGTTVTATPGTYVGIPTPVLTRVWTRDGVAIGGATLVTYTRVAADAGTQLRYVETATNALGFISQTVDAAIGKPWNTALPSIDNALYAGGSIQMTDATWAGATSQVRDVLVNGIVVVDDASEATVEAYVLLLAQEGLACAVRSIATGPGGSTSADSAAVTVLVTLDLTTGSYSRTGEGSYRTGAATDGGSAFVAWAAANARRDENRGDGAGALVLLERAGTNTIANSEAIGGAGWFGTATQAADQTTAPDGASDADRMSNAGTTFDQCRRYSSNGLAASTIVSSGWVKQDTGTTASIQTKDGGTEWVTDATPAAAWQRVVTPVSVTGGFAEIFNKNGGQNGAGVATDKHYWWGVQAELGRYATSYIRTSGGQATRGADTLTIAQASVPAVLLTRPFEIPQVSPRFASADLVSGDVRWLWTIAGSSDGVRVRHTGSDVRIEAVVGGVVKASSGALSFARHALLGAVRWDPVAAIITVGGVAGSAGTAWSWSAGDVRIGGIFAGAGSELDGRVSSSWLEV